MSKIGFLTDSCSDIPQELASKVMKAFGILFFIFCNI